MSGTGQEESPLQSEQKSEQPKEHTFSRFTEKVRIVLLLAQEEAMRRQLHYIDTEHLLLGLVNEIEGVVPQTSPVGPVSDGEDVADQILSNLGVKTQQIRAELEQMNHWKLIKPKKIGLTPGAKKVIELTVYESRNLEYEYIGTGQLLLGLLREKKGKAAVTLKRLEIDLKKARAQLVQTLPTSSSSPKRNK